MQNHDRGLEVFSLYARDSMLAFTKCMNPDFRINWHHRVICETLDDFVAGKITRLMIFLQPQIGKSELVSRNLPAYIFGRDPDHRVIAATYGDSFASEFNMDVQRIMDSPSYRSVFPKTKLAGNGEPGIWLRNSSRFDIVGHKGRYHSVGVGGSLTGRTGNTLIIDDPVKNKEEADSKTFRDRQFSWYTTVARTRLQPSLSGQPRKVLLTMTRWHEDDLAARLIAAAQSDPDLPQWTVLSFPAIKEDDINPLDQRKLGEPLWTRMTPMSELQEIKATDSRAWSALYQQRPAPDSGYVFKREWFKFYRAIPDLSHFDKIVQSWDLTYKDGEHSDYVVGTVWGRIGARKLLLDMVRGRMSFTGSINAIHALSQKWPTATAKYIEEAANGAAAIDTLRNKVSGIIPVRPRTSKLARASAVSPQFEAGNIELPDPSIFPMIHDYVEEMVSFPASRNDDCVDSTTQALIQLEQSTPMDWAPVSLKKESYWRLNG